MHLCLQAAACSNRLQQQEVSAESNDVAGNNVARRRSPGHLVMVSAAEAQASLRISGACWQPAEKSDVGSSMS